MGLVVSQSWMEGDVMMLSIVGVCFCLESELGGDGDSGSTGLWERAVGRDWDGSEWTEVFLRCDSSSSPSSLSSWWCWSTWLMSRGWSGLDKPKREKEVLRVSK